MTDQEKWILITRCLSGEASQEEQHKLDRWLTENQDNRDFYAELHTFWLEAKPAQASAVDPKALRAYQKLRTRIQADMPEKRKITPMYVQQPARKQSSWSQTLRIAASFFILVSLTTIAFYVLQHRITRERQVEWLTVTNPAGKRTTVILPDSSVVWLNANSSITYPQTFGTKREVKLSGEAFFEVTENKAAPFQVTAGTIRTTVLGTSFNIHAFDDEADATVTVVTGKVEVAETLQQENNGQHNVLGLLTANKKIVFHKTNRHAELTTLEDAYHDIAWKDGVLAFHDLSFGEIAERLERWYGVTIQFEHDALRACALEGTFKNLPLDQVLSLLKMTSNFNYTIQGKEVRISGRSCTE